MEEFNAGRADKGGVDLGLGFAAGLGEDEDGDATDRLTLSAFGSTTQDDSNQRGGVNSANPLNFLSGTTNPYYLYGVLKDISNNYGFDADFTISPAVSMFAEYSHELYHKRMTSRSDSCRTTLM